MYFTLLYCTTLFCTALNSNAKNEYKDLTVFLLQKTGLTGYNSAQMSQEAENASFSEENNGIEAKL